MIGEHGVGMIHMAWRADKGAMMKDAQFRFGGPSSVSKRNASALKSRRRHRDVRQPTGEPMHQLGRPINLHFDEPFYVGVGFCSHLPATPDTAVLSNVALENSAGQRAVTT